MVQASQEYSSDVGQLADLRRWITQTCREAWQLDAQAVQKESALHEILLAVQEAATNVIRHAYKGQHGQPLKVAIEADEDRIRVTLSHFGTEFDPAQVPPPDFDGSRTGGFGVYMIEQLVDEVAYTCEDASGCRTIELLKHRHKRDLPVQG